MTQYLQDEIFNEFPDSMLYIERTIGTIVRRGLVGAIDLEHYDYKSGATTPIRATEQTVIERIPPRVKIRKDAKIELPHVMLLVDDPQKSVIEPLTDMKGEFSLAYDFELMLGGGHLRGWFIPKAVQERVQIALDKLAQGDCPLLFAVGDGNHSLATAKECAALSCSPLARFALTEIVNIHDESLEFEPIYRVVWNIDVQNLICELKNKLSCEGEEGFELEIVSELGCEKVKIKKSAHLPVGVLQSFLDEYIKAHPGVKIDYIHGVEELREAVIKESGVGFIFDGMKKSELFSAVSADGSLPRKTFSMGHARDKRYYVEGRKIK